MICILRRTIKNYFSEEQPVISEVEIHGMMLNKNGAEECSSFL